MPYLFVKSWLPDIKINGTEDFAYSAFKQQIESMGNVADADKGQQKRIIFRIVNRYGSLQVYFEGQKITLTVFFIKIQISRRYNFLIVS